MARAPIRLKYRRLFPSLRLKAHITANYYTCTDEILAGLGKMYVADERFEKYIDKCCEGTAEFVADAIATYVM